MANLPGRAKRVRHAAILAKRGFRHPLTLLQEADREGVSHVTAVALVEQETGNGRNVFGHDDVKNPAPKGRWVSKPRYIKYKKDRQKGLGMQGVGPVQLTWWEYQDEADREGGCWVPRYNYRIGFRHLARLIKAHGWHKGVKLYNGTGPAADAYERAMKIRHTKWAKILK